MAFPALLIFDCDGVLIDSELISARVHCAYKAELGFPMSIAEHIRRYTGLSVESQLECAEIQKLPTDFFDRLRPRQWEAFRAELKAIRGMHDVLPQIQCMTCVASSSSVERLELTLGLVGLKNHFAGRIFSAQMVARGKPAPDLFLHAASLTGHAPADCLVIEDSPAGVQAAKAAGMTVFGFTGGSHMNADLIARLQQTAPDLIFSDMLELPARLAVANQSFGKNPKRS